MSPFDVGAYETDGLVTNPGWKVGPADFLPPLTPSNLRVQ